MVATYPVPPLFEGHPLAIGVTSYDGHVFYGLTADRDMLPDADLLGRASRGARRAGRVDLRRPHPRPPRGRRKRKPAEKKAAAKKTAEKPEKKP